MASPATLTETVYGHLREAIVLGKMSPGEKLVLTELARREGVSFNVVREALNRLTGEGLVHAAPQQGFAVASMTRQELVDLLDVRIEVECLGMTRSIERRDLEWQSSLVAAYHRLSNTPVRDEGETGISMAWHRAHLLFHTSLFSGSGNPRMCALAVALSDEYALYRGWALSLLPDERLHSQDHEPILRAALDGDAKVARERLADHYRRTVEVLLQAGDPGRFIDG